MQVISAPQAYQFLARLNKEYSLARWRTHLTCSGASKDRQLYVLQPGYSDCLDSAGMPCQCPCFDRRRESPLCSVEHFSEPGFEFCSPCHLGRNTCSLANALASERRCTPSFPETKASRKCCIHEKTNPSGRWYTGQTSPPESTRRSLTNEGLHQPLSLPLG